jgi:hypothetical protein
MPQSASAKATLGLLRNPILVQVSPERSSAFDEPNRIESILRRSLTFIHLKVVICYIVVT